MKLLVWLVPSIGNLDVGIVRKEKAWAGHLYSQANAGPVQGGVLVMKRGTLFLRGDGRGDGISLAIQQLALHASTARGTRSAPSQGTEIPQAKWPPKNK